MSAGVASHLLCVCSPVPMETTLSCKHLPFTRKAKLPAGSAKLLPPSTPRSGRRPCAVCGVTGSCISLWCRGCSYFVIFRYVPMVNAEIVFTQMTKGCLFALGAGWDHVADLDLIVVNNDTVDQQFYQLSALSEIKLFQGWRQALTEVFDMGRQLGHIELFLGLRLQLSKLLRQPVLSLE